MPSVIPKLRPRHPLRGAWRHSRPLVDHPLTLALIALAAAVVLKAFSSGLNALLPGHGAN